MSPRRDAEVQTPHLRQISPRQLECLAWVRLGKSSTDIAAILGLSPYTVDEHIAAACAKLGVRTRHEAVLVCVRLELLPP